MLRKETVDPGTLELLKYLMSDERLSDFFLVGGTALSLQIGHRISIDLDLFTLKPFDENILLEYLEQAKKFEVNLQNKNTLKGKIAGIQVDCIMHAYPLVESLLHVEGIRMASLQDIAAMKLNAIVGTGSRLKDFVDIAFLSYYLSLKEMIEAYENKYELRNPFSVLKAISYHSDINFADEIQMINVKLEWKVIEKRLKEMEKYPDEIFPEMPLKPAK